MLRRLALTALPLAAAAGCLMGASPVRAMPVPSLASWTCVGQCGSTAAAGDLTESPLGNPSFGFVRTAGSTATSGVVPTALAGLGATNGSVYRSSTFQALGPVDAYFNYLSTDGRQFSDFAWARLINQANQNVTWLFAASSSTRNSGAVVPGGVTNDFDPDAVIENFQDFKFTSLDAPSSPLLGDSDGLCFDQQKTCGITGWLHASVNLALGNYQLEVGVANVEDRIFNAALAFDFTGLAGGDTQDPGSTVPEPGSVSLLLAAGAAALLPRRRRRA